MFHFEGLYATMLDEDEERAFERGEIQLGESGEVWECQWAAVHQAIRHFLQEKHEMKTISSQLNCGRIEEKMEM